MPFHTEQGFGLLLSQVCAAGILLVAMVEVARSEVTVTEWRQLDDYSMSKLWGLFCGVVMATALLPAPHSSVWTWLSGRPFDLMLNVHRACGHLSCLGITIHLAYALKSQGTSGMLDLLLDCSSNQSGDGILFGTLAGGAMLVLAATAVWLVRRRWYSVFLTTHRAMFVLVAVVSSLDSLEAALPY